MEKNINRCLDFLKGLGCIGIILIHCSLPGITGIVINKIFQFVVPMFFMISGYYAYNSDKEYVKTKISKKIKKIVYITIISYALYIIYTFIIKYNSAITKNFFDFVKTTFSGKNLFNILVFNNLSVISAPHLWFLPTLIHSYIFLYIINKYDLYKLGYILIPITIGLKILVTGVENYSWIYQGNVLLYGIPYLMIGNLIAKYNVTIKESILISILIISLICSFGKILFNIQFDFFIISEIVYAIAIFKLAVQNPNKYVSKSLEDIGKKYSLFIYVVHIIVIRIFILLTKSYSNWNLAILSIITSLAVAIIIEFIIKKIKSTKILQYRNF